MHGHGCAGHGGCQERHEGGYRHGGGEGPGHHGMGHRHGGGPGFFGGPPFFGGRMGRGPKAARGDVRMAVLTLVAEQPRHGYEIMQELSNRSHGMWQPSPGSIYPTLQALEDEELLSSAQVEGKRVYSLTEAGREYVAANPRPTPPWDEMASDTPDNFFALKREIGQIAAAAMQGAHAGTEDQLARVLKVLTDARKSIYRIMAEDDDS